MQLYNRFTSATTGRNTSTSRPGTSSTNTNTTYIKRFAIAIIVYLLITSDNPTTRFIRQRRINNRLSTDNPYGPTLQNKEEFSNEIQKIIKSRFIPTLTSSSSTNTGITKIANHEYTTTKDTKTNDQIITKSSSSLSNTLHNEQWLNNRRSISSTSSSILNNNPLLSTLPTYYIPYKALESTLQEEFLYQDDLPTAFTEEQIYRVIPQLKKTTQDENGNEKPSKYNRKTNNHIPSSPRTMNLLVFGVGEMLGSSIVRMCLHHPSLCNVVLGIEDFSTGFITVIPSGITFLEIPYDEKGIKRLFSTLDSINIPLSSIDAIIFGFDNILNTYATDAISSFLQEYEYMLKTNPTASTKHVIKPPVFIFPDTFSRPHGIQSEPILFAADGGNNNANYQDKINQNQLFQTIYQRWFNIQSLVYPHINIQNISEHNLPTHSLLNSLEDFNCASLPSQSTTFNPSSSSSLSMLCKPDTIVYREKSLPESVLSNNHRHAILAFVNIGNNPAIGPGIQKNRYNDIRSPSMNKLFNNNFYSGPLYTLTECLDIYATKTTHPAYHNYNLLPLLETFERALKANPAATEPDENSPEYFLHSCEGAFLNSLETLPIDVDALGLGILGATVNIVYNTDIEIKMKNVPDNVPWFALPLATFFVNAKKDATTTSSATKSTETSSSSESTSSSEARRLSTTESSSTPTTFSLLYSSSLPTLAVEASGSEGYIYYKNEHMYHPLDIVPAPLWSLTKAFKLSELSPESLPIIERLYKFADTIIQSLNNNNNENNQNSLLPSQAAIKIILLHLLETSWWIFRHGALSGYREPFPSDDDFGGIDYSRLSGKDKKTSSSSESLNLYGKLQLLRGDKYGNAFAYGNKYTLRDIYFFGVTHHTIHHKAAASAASYCWRLRRGGVKWYSTTFDPILPVLAIDHPAGQHYGTLFLRVAMVWEHVHVATTLSYPWYVRIWDDNYIISEGYVATANLVDSSMTVALGRIGEHNTRKGKPYFFTGGGACALLSNALVRVQARIMPSCRQAAEHWYYNRPPSTPGFDPDMPECAPGRFGCEDVVISYCLRKALGSKYVIVRRPGFNHVDAETLNSKGLFDCRGLACRRRVKAEDNEGKAELTIVLHWVKSGESMMRYDNALYGKEIMEDKDYCVKDSVDLKCLNEFAL